ncbi:MAG: RNA methyltransferase [Bacteroidaceae bacterium]|nr:RNA methyltransferase [Bacteroidaceae bacterium]
MKLERITDFSHPGVEVYGALTEAQLRNRLEPDKGLFIAESPKVIGVALDAGLQPISLLCEERHIGGDANSIIRRIEESYGGDFPVYTGSRQVLAGLTGYTLTRGVLCAMRRPQPPSLEEVCLGARRIAVIHGVVDSTNVGSIFRSAAALGIDGVLLTTDSCDPLNRRALRVSMGSVLLVPWTWVANPLSELPALGFRTVAMALTDRSIPLTDARLRAAPRLAIIMGTEGDGLPRQAIEGADYVVRIPMYHGVDSLNVAAASAVAFWELCEQPEGGGRN